MSEAKPVLVSGGAGFVGSHLAEYLNKQGIPVIIVDNLSTGKKENLKSLSNYKLVVGDCCNSTLMSKLIKQSSILIHLAALVGLKKVISNPLETLRTNIESVKVGASLCAKFNIPIVFFSSSSAYGNKHNNLNRIFNEEINVHIAGNNSASIYAETKILGESICEYYGKYHGLKYIIVRPFNLIGTRQTSLYGMVVPTFIKSALNGKPLTIFGTGKQTRTFSDVDLAMELLWKLLQNKKSYNNIFNLAASNKQTSIIELAELIKKISKKDLNFQFVSYDDAYGTGYVDIIQRVPSIKKLESYVGTWSKKSLEKTLLNIFKFSENNFK